MTVCSTSRTGRGIAVGGSGGPWWGLRVATALAIVALVAALVVVPMVLSAQEELSVFRLVELSDAGLNVLLMVGAAILFLVTLETRIKRGRALEAIHELRVVAHIIDMHQLTKDPDRAQGVVTPTESSPRKTMGPRELARYLDYCSEMLSLTGKVASLYAQGFSDADTLASVNQVEALTTGLSRKIWQKMMILHAPPVA